MHIITLACITCMLRLQQLCMCLWRYYFPHAAALLTDMSEHAVVLAAPFQVEQAYREQRTADKLQDLLDAMCTDGSSVSPEMAAAAFEKVSDERSMFMIIAGVTAMMSKASQNDSTGSGSDAVLPCLQLLLQLINRSTLWHAAIRSSTFQVQSCPSLQHFRIGIIILQS